MQYLLYFRITVFLIELRTIEINTTQNVTIEYELAPYQKRMLAFLLDFAVILVATFILSRIGAAIFDSEGGGALVFNYFVVTPVILFYTLVSEVFLNGQTLGKKVLGIRVIKINGKQATLSDYIIRWLFRLLDIYLSLGAVASILINSTDKSQRIGDIIAGTVLINLKPSRAQGLRDLLNIHTLDNYQPTYPEVKYMQEDDLLLVKSVLERNRKYKNRAHEEALDELVKKVMEILHIPKLKQEKTEFLRTVLNDYIVLTR